MSETLSVVDPPVAPEQEPPPGRTKLHIYLGVLVGSGGKSAGGCGHVNSVERLMLHSIERGYDLTVRRESASGIDRSRNVIVAAFLASEATHLLFIDNDITFEPDDVLVMAMIGQPIVCGPYPRKDLDWQQIEGAVKSGVPREKLHEYATSFVINLKPEQRNQLLFANVGGVRIRLIDVEEAGTGFMMIRREALERYIDYWRPGIEYTTDYEPRDAVHHLVFYSKPDSGCPRELALTALITAARNRLDHVEDGHTATALDQAAIAYARAERDPSTMGRYLTEDYEFCRRWKLMSPENKILVLVDARVKHWGGAEFTGHLGNFIGWPAEWVEETVEGEYDVPGLQLEKPRILDLGSNIGLFSTWAAKRWPGAKIVAVEPHPINVEKLRRRVQGLEVDVLQAALVSLPGVTAKLRIAVTNPGAHSLYDTGEQGSETVEVPTMHPANLPPADFVKIDTEGAELDILQHYPHLGGAKAVVMEYHRDDHIEPITKLCEAAGLERKRHTPYEQNRGILHFVRAA